MVGVPVSPVRIERKHHLRLEPANMLDNPADGLRWLGLIELAVRVVQKYNLSQAQHLSGGPEFSFDEAGLYPIVTHKFANVGKGALGLFQAGEVAATGGGH